MQRGGEEFNTNVSNLIEKWEVAGGGGSKLEVEEGGSSITRRTSSEFLARQAIFEGCQEGKYPDLSSFKFQTYTPYFQNQNTKNGRNFNNIESDSFKDYIYIFNGKVAFKHN